MFRITIVCFAVLGLAACGGGSRYDRGKGYAVGAPAVLFASGPIQNACQASDRKARSRSRCGCVQAVADQSLSSADQRRGATYFKDPHKLQDVRQSSNASNERFWLAWKAFGESAARQCGDS